ncbi:MAG: hypothetical protein HRT40_02980 [Campylobacteraceae bacterium]|nr:hypothetical protein [Campylobacteraceae bacterium]
MKNLTNGLFRLTIVIGLTGCGGISWMNIDKSKVNKDKITIAEKKCNVNKKLYNLIVHKNSIDDIIFITEAKGKSKEIWLKVHQRKHDKIHNEIETCMKLEGLQKQE